MATLTRNCHGKRYHSKKVTESKASFSFARIREMEPGPGLDISVEAEDGKYNYRLSLSIEELNRALAFMEKCGELKNNRVILNTAAIEKG